MRGVSASRSTTTASHCIGIHIAYFYNVQIEQRPQHSQTAPKVLNSNIARANDLFDGAVVSAFIKQINTLDIIIYEGLENAVER